MTSEKVEPIQDEAEYNGFRLSVLTLMDQIIFQKYEKDRTCAVTGEFLNENVESVYAKGLYLSSRGAELLLEELQNKTQG